jgi:hypothetical protein
MAAQLVAFGAVLSSTELVRLIYSVVSQTKEHFTTTAMGASDPTI